MTLVVTQKHYSPLTCRTLNQYDYLEQIVGATESLIPNVNRRIILDYKDIKIKILHNRFLLTKEQKLGQ